MKIIFLDVDGVLNTQLTYLKKQIIYKRTGIMEMPIEPTKLDLLKEIIDKTDAKIVLSSDWRQYFSKTGYDIVPVTYEGILLNDKLKEHEIELFDLTKVYKDRNRGAEIEEWLNNNIDIVDSFLVLDDHIYDMYNLPRNNIIQTKFYAKFYIDDSDCGLLREHVDKAVEILNNRKIFKLWKK